MRILLHACYQARRIFPFGLTLARRAGSSISDNLAHEIPNNDHWSLRSLPLGLGVLFGIAAPLNIAQQKSELQEEDVEQKLPQNPSSQKGWHLLDENTRRKTFYKYERRIRDFSQPDKVFHYFASRTLDDGTRVMTPDDLVRAVIAVYPAEASEEDRTGRLSGEPQLLATKKAKTNGRAANCSQDSQFLASFDANSDGISFSEYMLLLTFLKIPQQDVRIYFEMLDLNDDGTINQKEFEGMTKQLQKKVGKIARIFRTGASIEHEDSSKGLKTRFFGPEGGRALKLQEFSDFIAGMHTELLKLEFDHYAAGQPSICGKDFARSVLSAVDLARIDAYLDRVAALPEKLATFQISFEQFLHFARLYQHVHSLAVALESFHNISGRLEKSDFQRATKIVTGSPIPGELVEIIFQLFDTNGDGDLSQHELIAVLRKREGSRGDKRSSEGQESQSLLSCLYACAFERN